MDWTTVRKPKKPLVEDTVAIRVKDILRANLLERPVGSYCEGGNVERGVLWEASLQERQDNSATLSVYHRTMVKSKQVETSLILERNPSKPKGLEWWFVCRGIEGSGCGKRVDRLFLPLRLPAWGCRTCHGLGYYSSRVEDKRVRYWLNHPDELHMALVTEMYRIADAPTNKPRSMTDLDVMRKAEELLKQAEQRESGSDQDLCLDNWAGRSDGSCGATGAMSLTELVRIMERTLGGIQDTSPE